MMHGVLTEVSLFPTMIPTTLHGVSLRLRMLKILKVDAELPVANSLELPPQWPIGMS